MQQTISPSIEVDRGPVVWGGLVTVLCGAIAMFAFNRPDWLLPSAMVGGAVAAARSGFYDQSATNGFLGVAFALVLFLPLIFVYRTLFRSTVSNPGDAVFVGVSLTVVDAIVYGPLMAILGFVTAALVDMVRRRSSGRVGY